LSHFQRVDGKIKELDSTYTLSNEFLDKLNVLKESRKNLLAALIGFTRRLAESQQGIYK
jgi:hypothetical protein